jgi:aspartyl-tRNA(Asn)/glutamyl-tRNA(Gln) amidotransferase subunit C
MKIDDALIDRLAELSRLEFEENEKAAIKTDLQKMLNFVDKLNEFDTEGVEPLIFMTEEMNRLREDVAEHTITKEEALKNAPKKDSDFFKVPKVISAKE